MTTVTPDRAQSPLILALDIGTSSVRALLFDRLGRALQGTLARQAYEIRTTPAGASEVDPDALLEQVWRCIDHVLARAGALGPHIAAVAPCTFVSNVLGLNDQGRAVTPLITYADTRPVAQVHDLRAQLDEAAVHQRTGCRFHTSYLPARFRWLPHADPDLFHRAARWVSIGEASSSPSPAAGRPCATHPGFRPWLMGRRPTSAAAASTPVGWPSP